MRARNPDVAGLKIAPRAWRRLLVRAGAAALLACAAVAWLPAGSASAALTVSKWEAGTCKEVNCEDSGPTSRFYTQAAGHPDFGITDFRFAATKVGLGHEAPTGKVKDVRVDLPPGLAVNPEATEQCTEAQLDQFNCPAGSQVGEDEAVGTATALELLHLGLTVTEHFPVYNMQRLPGEPARFGVEVNSPRSKRSPRWDTTCAGRSTSKAGQLAARSGNERKQRRPHGGLPRVLQDPEPPHEPEVIESKLIFWASRRNTARRCSHRVHHVAEHVHEQARDLPARRLLRSSGRVLRLRQRNTRGRDRLQPARLQPFAGADRRRHRAPTSPTGSRPTCTCRSSPANRRSPTRPTSRAPR